MSSSKPGAATRALVCVVGAANMDLISYVPRLPRMGETLHGHRFHMGYGGKGANQAVMAAKLGGDVAMVAKLGRDFFGEGTLENFATWGVDSTSVSFTEEAFSGVAPIAVDDQGRNSIIIVTGANDLLGPQDIAEAEPIMAQAAVVVCQLEIPLETTLAALTMGRDNGATTIFNPAPARPHLPSDLYQVTDIFCPNESEAEMIVGHSVESLDDAERAADKMLELGAGSVVLTLGERGCLVANERGVTHVSVEPVDVVDSTGAGDAFVGSLAHFIARAHSLTDAVNAANQIAAISVTATGTQTSFPTAEDLSEGLMA